MKLKPLKDGSHNQKILHYMARGRTVTVLSALRLFDCLNLGGRIYDLRRRGWRIESDIIKLKNGKRIAAYFMPAARAH